MESYGFFSKISHLTEHRNMILQAGHDVKWKHCFLIVVKDLNYRKVNQWNN